MSYIIKTYDGDKVLYFYKMCRKVYTPDETPAFREDLADAHIFAMKDEAYLVMAQIAKIDPDVHLELEEIAKKSSLRDLDGYVPLKNTVAAMLSDDHAERIWAEYQQLNTRRHKLKEHRNSLKRLCANPVELKMIDEQIDHMFSYMMDLLTRCEFEGINLSEVEKGLHQHDA